MKIQIIGNHPSAEMLRQYLEALGYQTGSVGAKYKVEFARCEPVEVQVSGAECELTTESARMIRELCTAPVHVSRGSGSAVKIALPEVAEIHCQAALGTLRAVLKVTEHGAPSSGGATAQPPGGKKKAGVIGWIKQHFK